MNEKFIAVIGAGVIGSDVALDLSIHNYRVLLKDLSSRVLEKALDKIKKSYRFTKMMKNTEPPPLDEILTRIKTTTDYAEFKKVDFVINIPMEISNGKEYPVLHQ